MSAPCQPECRYANWLFFPILSASQKGEAPACLEESEPPDKLIAICETALARASAPNADTRDTGAVARSFAGLASSGRPLTLIDIALAMSREHQGGPS
ncbi:hypothetical protein BWR18_13450 [Tateyamaria omphalii]|uniref:Uncharacterized protein n=1 Tax=Tateyamaria omphalii TaxID=299262 RepID=A0A1P8MX45_9RHOB|nr:hypothetical protein BWR18_13450 [Tateyamaria omphalii]